MKTICNILLLSCLFALPAAHAADLTVELTGITATEGTLRIAVADSPESWSTDTGLVATATRRVTRGQETLVFTDLPPGIYAVKAMHDENNNGKLDTNALAVPVEAYGFSNNPQPMRAATFEEAAFELTADGVQVGIRMD